MWALILLVVGAAVAGPSGNYATGPRSRVADTASHTFTQKLDHFNTAETRVWAQDYYETADYYKAGGPALIYVGGTESISGRIFQDTFIGQLAEALGAKAFALQHRYFGPSHPTEDLTVSNLKFMSQDQAVEDLAMFIEQLHKSKEITAETKVVVYGGGYGGNVATWARVKHPDLVHVAVASGAPLLPKMEFTEFLLKSLDFIDTQQGNKKCRANIRTAMKYLDGLTQAGADVTKFIKALNPFENTDENVAAVFHDLAELVWDYVRTTTPNLPMVTEMCSMVTAVSTPEMMVYYLTSGWQQADCMNISYDRSIATASSTAWGQADQADQVQDRLSLYQSCFEQGQFKTQNQEWYNRSSLEIALKECEDVFGDTFQATALQATVDAAREAFESQLPTLSQVIFVQSSQDPYAYLGVRESSSDAAPLVTIEGTEQCADLDTNPDTSTDAKSAGRQKIIELVKVFLEKPLPTTTAGPTTTAEPTTTTMTSSSSSTTPAPTSQPTGPTSMTTAHPDPTKKPNAGVSLSHSLTVLGMSILTVLVV